MTRVRKDAGMQELECKVQEESSLPRAEEFGSRDRTPRFVGDIVYASDAAWAVECTAFTTFAR